MSLPRLHGEVGFGIIKVGEDLQDHLVQNAPLASRCSAGHSSIRRLDRRDHLSTPPSQSGFVVKFPLNLITKHTGYVWVGARLFMVHLLVLLQPRLY